MRYFVRSSSSSRDGVALVLVLAFIVLTSILVISFITFSSSNHSSTSSYAKAIQAQEIAQGGLQDILNDLHQEIVAGSTSYAVGSTTIYVPTANYTAAPQRLGYNLTAWGNDVNSPASDDLSPSLVRVSRASQTGTKTDLYPPMTNSYFTSSSIPLNRASSASTLTPSLNGRYVSFARWNKSLMLAPTTVAGDPQASTYGSYVIPGIFATNYTATTNSLRMSGTSPGGQDGYSAAPPPYGPPDWIYVTRGGSRALTTADLQSTSANVLPSNNLESTNAVIGRYAYIIYDEGALLDINVAGFPSSATNGTSASYLDTNSGITQEVLGKSYPAYADLSITQLMGGGVSTSAAQTTISNFLNWRNAGGLTASGNNYLAAVATYATNGFLGFTNTDSPLVSRQDLINYMINVDPPSSDGTTGYNSPVPYASRALPYLGTFTRSLAAPSYFPTTNAPAGGIYNYNSNAEVTTGSPFSTTSPNPNPDLANLRWPAGGTVQHYSDNATNAPTLYTVAAGTPFLQTRFSLAKIAWLSQVSPQPSDNKTALPTAYITPIQSCFGLTWGIVGSANGGNACWSYVGSPAGPGGTQVPFNGTIETLSQVAKEGREPNFFELLKAAILSGSLGTNVGPCGWSNGTLTPWGFRDGNPYTGGPEDLDIYSFDRAGSIAAPTRITDMQVMKIGANIIDQYDADSYPTAIYFNYFLNSANTGGLTTYSNYDASGNGPASIDHTLYGESNMVFGDENLPYLNGGYLIAGTYHVGDPSGLNGWIQPQLWNQHQMPTTFNASPPPPYLFQIRAYGQASLVWGKEQTPPGSEAMTGSTETPSGELDGSYININTVNNTGLQQFYATPVPTTTTIPGVTVSAQGSSSSITTSMAAASTMEEYTLNPFVAFWLGDDSTYIVDPDTIAGVNQLTKTNLETTSGYTMALGWTDSLGGFHPYSFMVNMIGFSYGVLGLEKNPGGSPANDGSAWPAHTGDDVHFLIEPRTARFGTLFDWDSSFFQATFNPSNVTPPTSTAGRHTDTSGWGVPTVGNFFYASPTGSGNYLEDWEVNQSAPISLTGALANYYKDPDGVIRPGDGMYRDAATGDGMQLYTINGTGGTALGDTGNTQHGRRPVILNRPFRNVGELGYTFRDYPFKTLDFFSPFSADAGLLDVFSIQDDSHFTTTPQNTIVMNNVVAGRVNPNNSPLPVLESIFSYASKKDLDPTYNMSSSDIKAVAKAAVGRLGLTTGPNPIRNRAELVTSVMNKAATGMVGVMSANSDKYNKAYFEAPIRALADNVETRSWTLLIDVVAQSGHFSPTATTLDNFIVDGEKRYWLHVSIDRYTGQIIDQQLEPVYE